MSTDAGTALTRLIEATLALTSDRQLLSPFDATWRSPCEVGRRGNQTCWCPIRQSPEVDFSGLANALEARIHPDIRQYYGSYWSGTLETTSTDKDEGRVSLIQLWNMQDFDRLIANLIGHALAKQRQRQGMTVFFANTEPDSELFLSIDNETGTVLLEEPGKPPLRKVAANVATFLSRLTPTLKAPDLY